MFFLTSVCTGLITHFFRVQHASILLNASTTFFVFPITFISSPALTPVSFKPPSHSSPSPCFLYALRAQLVSTQSWEALEVKEETEGRGVEGREGEG